MVQFAPINIKVRYKGMRFHRTFTKSRREGFPESLCQVTVVNQMFGGLDIQR